MFHGHLYAKRFSYVKNGSSGISVHRRKLFPEDWFELGFSEALLRCPMASKKRPLAASADRGQMHHWRTGDLDIPCQVASPQSLTPFLQADVEYP